MLYSLMYLTTVIRYQTKDGPITIMNDLISHRNSEREWRRHKKPGAIEQKKKLSGVTKNLERLKIGAWRACNVRCGRLFEESRALSFALVA